MKQYSNSNNIILAGVTAADFLVMNLLLAVFIVFLPDTVPEYFHSSTRITVVVANSAMLLAQLPFHTIIHRRLLEIGQVLGNVLRLVAVQVLLMLCILKFLSMSGGYFKFTFILFATEYVVLCVSRIIEREVLMAMRKRGRNTHAVVFVGDDLANIAVYHDLVSDPSTGYRVLGYYADSPILGAPEAFRRLGTLAELYAKMDDDDASTQLVDIDELFCSMSHSRYDEIVRIMQFCDKNIIQFFYVPRAFGNYRLDLKPERFGTTIIYTDHLEPLSLPGNKAIKRAFDIVVSSIACLALLPLIPIIGLIIKLQSPGPIFFRQMRTGLNGQTFECLKFRSMHVNRNADTAQATKDDPRKFPFGNFIRHTNIDEFPQFFNVLRGDMSIVGPRPHMLHHTEMYSSLINKYMVRHFCKPGITGWAQVTGFRGETKELWQIEERVRRDIWYIEHWTFWLDLRIIFLTARTIFLPDKNAY